MGKHFDCVGKWSLPLGWAGVCAPQHAWCHTGQCSARVLFAGVQLSHTAGQCGHDHSWWTSGCPGLHQQPTPWDESLENSDSCLTNGFISFFQVCAYWSTCGACMRFISSRRVWRGPSEGLLFFRASRRNDVHCWIRLYSINTSTIWTKTEPQVRNKPKIRLHLYSWEVLKKQQKRPVCIKYGSTYLLQLLPLI